MDVEREFAARPPKEELATLSAIVRDFKWRFPRNRRDMVVEFCKSSREFLTAAQRAVDSRDVYGKMHNHQSRVKATVRADFLHRITNAELSLRSAYNFDELHDRLDDIKPVGIGPVTLYDVAVRIGAWKGIEPTNLYLHAGVRRGWVALTGDPAFRKKRIPREDWPRPLRCLPADEVEDLLCTYRSVFPRLQSRG